MLQRPRICEDGRGFSTWVLDSFLVTLVGKVVGVRSDNWFGGGYGGLNPMYLTRGEKASGDEKYDTKGIMGKDF